MKREFYMERIRAHVRANSTALRNNLWPAARAAARKIGVGISAHIATHKNAQKWSVHFPYRGRRGMM